MDHDMHMLNQPNMAKEYLKFGVVIALTLALAALHSTWRGFELVQFLDSFMGSFFLVFGSFKVIKLKDFAYGFQSYDVVARRSLSYAYFYPFLQLGFAASYLLGVGSWMVDLAVILISLISSVGVVQELARGSKIRCVCLGSVVKLPLSRISIVEDFGMALMAVATLMLR